MQGETKTYRCYWPIFFMLSWAALAVFGSLTLHSISKIPL